MTGLKSLKDIGSIMQFDEPDIIEEPKMVEELNNEDIEEDADDIEDKDVDSEIDNEEEDESTNILNPHELSDDLKSKSIILKIFTKEQIKTLYHFALRVDIDDNNVKAEIISAYLGSAFDELGTGTNRIAFLHDSGYVIKLALN